MRKIIVSMNITLDGYIAGANGELDWHFGYWNAEMARYASEQLSQADTILLGRVTYEAMADYWPLKIIEPCYPREDLAFADMMNRYHKIVFSTTLGSAGWNNSSVARGGVRKEIWKLKQQRGKSIIVYGSGMLVATLMEYQFIDELVLWMHPVVLGAGKRLFGDLNCRPLELSRVTLFDSGVNILYYKTISTWSQSSKNGKISLER